MKINQPKVIVKTRKKPLAAKSAPVAKPETHTGIIKFYLPRENYGFIQQPAGPDVFFRSAAVPPAEIMSLFRGAPVYYRLMSPTVSNWVRLKQYPACPHCGKTLRPENGKGPEVSGRPKLVTRKQ